MSGQGKKGLTRGQQEDRKIQCFHDSVGIDPVNRAEQQGQYQQKSAVSGNLQGFPDPGKEKHRG